MPAHQIPDDAERFGRRAFRERLAKALLPLETELFQRDIEQAQIEARAEELLRARLAEKDAR